MSGVNGIDFRKIITEMNSELALEYQPGAFAWADKHMDNLHDKASRRLDSSIDEALAKNNWSNLKKETEAYKQTMLIIIRAFKAMKGIKEADSFLESL